MTYPIPTRTWAAITTLLAVLVVSATSAVATPDHAAADTVRATGKADATMSKPLELRSRAQKPAHTKLTAGQSREYVDVKFVEGSRVRLRGGTLVSTAGRDLAPAQRVLAGTSVRRVTRLFAAAEPTIDAEVQRTQQRSGRQQADLNLYYRLQLAPGADTTAVLDSLNAMDVVETAYAEPLATRPPTTPSFLSRQGYRSAASVNGIDADYASTVAGGTGANVRVLDVEYAWNGTHEDLSKIRASFIANGTYVNPFPDDNHGTAVIGELAADGNSLGVTGLVPDAGIYLTNASNVERGWDLANAIYTAAQNMSAGDVMLIEQQIAGPGGACGTDQIGCVPVEWSPANYDAIVNATSKGIIVVEPAGNGHQNLDATMYGGVFPGGRADSGAIIVGAGGAGGTCTAARSRLEFSNYGQRVDLQGWGECVTTTGYGQLQGGDHNSWYTAGFSGTSSASPIVASAAAALSSIAKQRGITLTPRDVRARLRASGSAQAFGAAGNIGPLPNLRSAIAGLSVTDSTPPVVTAPSQFVPAAGILNATVPVTGRWSASDASGINSYAVYLSTNNGAFVQQTLATATSAALTLALTPGNTYQWAVAAQDRVGNWSDYAYGTTFGVGMWQEGSGYVTYSSGWQTSTWASASGGALAIASAANASASFTFTGRNVAWVGTRATNRGQANIYLDGAFQETINLYSATTVARTVLASYVWSASGQHTIKVVVVGTAGRPTVDVDAFVRLT
jgi:serine protease